MLRGETRPGRSVLAGAPSWGLPQTPVFVGLQVHCLPGHRTRRDAGREEKPRERIAWAAAEEGRSHITKTMMQEGNSVRSSRQSRPTEGFRQGNKVRCVLSHLPRHSVGGETRGKRPVRTVFALDRRGVTVTVEWRQDPSAWLVRANCQVSGVLRACC